MKLLELRSKREGNYRRKTQSLEWVCRKEDEDRHVHFDEGSHGGSNWKSRRLELPTFNGQDVDDWILMAEKYFSYY